MRTDENLTYDANGTSLKIEVIIFDNIIINLYKPPPAVRI